MKTATFDLESTGVDTDNDRIITAFVRVRDGDTILYENSWIINPGVEVPKEASDVHGMTTEWVRENGRTDVATAIEEIVHELSEYGHYGFVICGYNHAFDLAMLEAEAKRYNPGVQNLRIKDWVPTYRFIDPAIFSRVFDKYVKGGHQLITVAKRNGIEVEEDRLHAADYDVEVTEKLVKIFLNRAWNELPELREGKTPDEFVTALQKWQADEKKKWAEHTTDYFESTGRTNDDGSKIVVSGSFPW